MPTIYFGSVSKKRNSTLQPTLASSYDCIIKQPASIDNPTFVIQDANFNMMFNYAKWDNTYYFIEDIVSVRNDIWEVSCVIDVLATYKADILASTQYVCYSSHNSNTWLPDTRIPLLKATDTNRNTVSMAGLFNTVGFYVLTAVGKNGCVAYAMDKSTLNTLLANISTWQNDGINNATALLADYAGGDVSIGMTGCSGNDIQDLGDCIAANLEHLQYAMTATYANVQHKLQQMMKSFGAAAVETGFIGNAYSLAPECIRSCIWVPFFASPFTDAGVQLYLGNYDSGVHPFTLKAEPATGSINIGIPWHYSDWRRGVCEDVYLYLPMVGMIQLSATSITNVSSLTIKYSATATDGVVCYEILADSNVIGTYSGQCSANYPIGINQQASAGEIAQAVIGGIDKTVSAAVNSSISPMSATGAVVSGVWSSAVTGYEVANVQNSTHLTTVGGIGGGAGVGLDLDIQCFTVAHETITTPNDMAATMGVPTMQPYPLAGLTGYCQCANAHVAASGAMAGELDAIDTYLNTGFYIE